MKFTIEVNEETIKEIKKIWDADKNPSLVEEKHKFKVGDIVVGNDKADKLYEITTKGVKLKVVDLDEDEFEGQIVNEDGSLDSMEYSVSYYCFDKCEEEQKTVCAMVTTPVFSFDKIGMALVGTINRGFLDVSNGWLKKHDIITVREDGEHIWHYPLECLEILSK